MVKIALCSKVLQNMELADAMRAAAEIGFRAVELFTLKKHLPPDSSPETVAGLKKLLGELNLELASLCAYVGNFDTKTDAECEAQMEVFKRHLEQANALDAPFIRVNPTYHGTKRNATPDEVKRFCEWAAKCADLAAGSGRGICLENNLSMIGTVAGTAEVLKGINRPNVVCSYDPGNIIRADKKNYAKHAIKTFAGRIAILQVKQVTLDVENLEDSSVFVYYDEGDVDYSIIYQALASSKSLRYISVECHRPPTEGMTEKDVAKREYDLIREHAKAYFKDLA